MSRLDIPALWAGAPTSAVRILVRGVHREPQQRPLPREPQVTRRGPRRGTSPADGQGPGGRRRHVIRLVAPPVRTLAGPLGAAPYSSGGLAAPLAGCCSRAGVPRIAACRGVVRCCSPEFEGRRPRFVLPGWAEALRPAPDGARASWGWLTGSPAGAGSFALRCTGGHRDAADRRSTSPAGAAGGRRHADCGPPGPGRAGRAGVGAGAGRTPGLDRGGACAAGGGRRGVCAVGGGHVAETARHPGERGPAGRGAGSAGRGGRCPAARHQRRRRLRCSAGLGGGGPGVGPGGGSGKGAARRAGTPGRLPPGPGPRCHRAADGRDAGRGAGNGTGRVGSRLRTGVGHRTAARPAPTTSSCSTPNSPARRGSCWCRYRSARPASFSSPP